jgi:hypothetical protein
MVALIYCSKELLYYVLFWELIKVRVKETYLLKLEQAVLQHTEIKAI